MTEEFTPLTIQDYVAQALTTDQRSDSGSLTFPLLGLFGETGSLLSEVKKKQRDRASYLGYAGAVVEELGDVLWYLTTVAARGGLSLGDIAGNLNRGYADWQRAPDGLLSFASLQPPIMTRRAEPTPAFEKTLLQLAGEVGLLMTDHEAGRLTNNQAALAGRLVAIMRTLIQAANEAGVTLEAAAVKNLNKIFDRWPRERIYPAPLDESAEAEEKLPRDLYVDVFERKVRGQTYVFQRCNGLNIGDRLTDNAMTADDYRFHDVFHYAYVAVLTWSPVIRSLFRLKRKSDPKIDEAQDGARATLIEEGVATWIFGQAVALNFFADVKVGELPFDMLKHIRQFVAGYEVEQIPLWLWEEAILQGYAAFRFLREHRRGRLHIDTNNRRLTIETLL
ncbi:nucleoside triphosphate pyrophosphohydrolase family protein [Bradyrhizobium diazoefficiens]|uniref:nucleoside triphosphate pyrophosphohydrolase family protein n=1 Tax=Bradyrhizobium diazoefficiens TaxID=1355477 RepID=UPI00190D9B98|nr:nucleoside triphosphate pyrophosphohydrolase family protein [Bradyrhizobium diazoefficiens]MBK3661092.1 nucleoside triphosphate pyrophosphohydrolase family protein [Bradyrhizobium diazoefficiens]